MWIVGDLDSSKGLGTVVNALKHIESETAVTRLGFVHVPPSTRSPSTAPRFSTILYQLLSASSLQTLAPSDLLSLVEEVIAQGDSVDNLDQHGRILSENPQRVLEGTPLHALTSSGWSATDTAAAAEFWRVGTDVAESLSIKSGQTHVLVNGRVSHVLPKRFKD